MDCLLDRWQEEEGGWGYPQFLLVWKFYYMHHASSNKFVIRILKIRNIKGRFSTFSFGAEMMMTRPDLGWDVCSVKDGLPDFTIIIRWCREKTWVEPRLFFSLTNYHSYEMTTNLAHYIVRVSRCKLYSLLFSSPTGLFLWRHVHQPSACIHFGGWEQHATQKST